jgi:membrane protease subunit HflK
MAWDEEDNKDGVKGPWGSREPGQQQPNKPKNPWDPQRPVGQDDMPDLDAVLRRLGSLFGGGRGRRPSADESKKGFGFIVLLIVALWLGTGFYRVSPGENAVLLTFGKWESTRSAPGLGYHIPWPVQTVMPVNVAFERRVEIGFRDRPGTDKVDAAPGRSDVSSESRMLTGDENIVELDFVVLWKISNAGNYLFHIRDPEATVRNVAESAMSETIGQTPIQTAMTEGRAAIEASTKDLMQKMLDQYQSGVVVTGVQLLSVDPPAPVVDAFDDVQRARADMERTKNEADTYHNDIVPRARGDAQKLLQDAEAYKEAVISKAKGEAARFTSVYDAYAQARDVTAKRIYIETMEEIMQNSKKVLVGDSKGGGVLPYLSLDRLQGTAKPEAAAAPAAQ